MIQLMPFTPDEVIDRLEKKLASVDSVTAMLDRGMTPEQILEELLGEFGLEMNEKLPVSYRCDCSRERISQALISIGKKDLQEMIDDGKPIQVNCHFCNKNYEFTVDELRELFKEGRCGRGRRAAAGPAVRRERRTQKGKKHERRIYQGGGADA